ncbi:MAG: hypothetical protein GX418_09400 [Clostridiales bacterium]|nr:hypothetical protein [Clostridiales bacterium]
MISWPFDSTVTADGNGNPLYSKTYSADVLARILSKYFRNGVFGDQSDNLQVVEDAGMNVTVKPGDALINGRHCYEESERTLAVQAAHATLDRIDTVVLRLDLSVSVLAADLYVVEGTAAATPTAPSLTRNASVYELGLSDLFIAKATTAIPQHRITDTRLNSARCGVVASVIGDTDTTAYYAQIASDLASFQAVQQAAFTAWFETARATLDGDTAGSLLNLIQRQSPVDLSVILPAAGWSDQAPYTQTASVDGVLATDVPLVDAALDADTATAQAQLLAYGCIGRVQAADGQITAVCLEDRPETDLPLRLRVIRGIRAEDPSGTTELTASMITAGDGESVQTRLDAHEALILEGVPRETATGETVTVYPLTGTELAVTVRAAAAQEGSGAPSLENRRPITGRAAVTVHHGETDYTLTPPTLLYGVAGAEDTIHNLGAVSHRTQYVAFTGTESWAVPTSGIQTETEARFYRTPSVAMADAAHGLCDAFPWDGAIDLTPAVWGERIGKLTTSANLQVIVLKSRLAGWSDAWTSTQKINAFKAFLAAQHALGTPVQLVYERAAALAETAAAVPLAAADGANALSADAGEVTVTYAAFVPRVLETMRADTAALRGELTGTQTDLAGTQAELTAAREDMAAVREALSEVAAAGLDAPVDGAYIHYATGVPTAYAGYNYVTLPCAPGETLYLTARVSGTGVALAVFYDAAMAYLGYDKKGASTAVVYTDEPTVVPAGAAFVRVTTTAVVPVAVKRTMITATAVRAAAAEARLTDAETRLAAAEAAGAEDLFDRAAWRERVADEQQKNDFRWNTPFDKAYITFTFDDCSDDVNIVADVFAAAGAPVCLSVPPSRLPTVTQSGETGLEVCRRVVANGGEILAHSFDILTASSTDADYEAILVDTRRDLAAAGFSVQGIIESGNGGDELTADYGKAVRYLRPYYRYSDRYGRGTGAEQYDNPRTYLKTTAAANHAAVDAAVAGHAWLIFASHRIDLAEPTATGTTRALVEDLLAYIAGLGAAVQIVTFAGMYAKFRSSVLERAVAALEA